MTDLSELKRLAEAAGGGEWRYRPHELDDWGEVRDADGWRICQARDPRKASPEALAKTREDDSDPFEDLAKFIAAANPATILSLIKRVEEAEGEVVKQSLTTAESHARGVAEGLERAAKVAEGVDPVGGERGQAWVAHSLYDNMRKHVAAAIRKGE